MQHIFIDAEAYGPPGHGRPFALGACKFDMQSVYARWQQNIAWPVGTLAGEQATLSWLSAQEPRVLAQMRGGRPFAQVWAAFLSFVGPHPTMFWADDFSDFAWLDHEARTHALRPLRELGSQYDSSGIVMLADPVPVYSEEQHGELVPHIAEHDAVRGAINLIMSLNILRRRLPGSAMEAG